MSNKIQLPNLKEYALNYLARYNNTEAGLVKLLKQKVNRWIKIIQNDEEQNYQQVLQEAYHHIEQIVKNLKQKGIINDETFVTSKIPTLIRAGCSLKQIQNRLLQKGVKQSLIQSSLKEYQNDNFELLSALVYVRKRKIGPFRSKSIHKKMNLEEREQMILARRGFSFTILKQVLSMNQSEAEEYLDQIRSL